ncbi:hypothetical protein [Thermotalea metallivorans]|uniref:Uncharacterized protein n=1 Tax=Thermotalea metallivorans TaxID=520762 RepID=A0A140LEG2_9FIRM|nr:hypothetical protein [Thermotalea metallivorans]KXG78937.1 hypothetical protein AN619_00970 [Thermotalea metallivorans]
MPYTVADESVVVINSGPMKAGNRPEGKTGRTLHLITVGYRIIENEQKNNEFCFTSIVLLSLGVVSYADNTELTGDIKPFAESDCPYGTHQMYSGGQERVLDPTHSYVIIDGGYYTCSKCGAVFVCTGYPHSGGPIAYHIFDSEIKFIGGHMGEKEF